MFILPVGVNRPIHHTPVFTRAIMGVCLLIQLAVTFATPARDWTIAYGYVTGYGSLLTLFTHMFMHAGFGHLIGNFIFLYLPGSVIEDALGGWKFLLFYLGSGVAANALFVMFSSGSPMPMVGASGAIAGLMGGFLILFPYSKVKMYWAIWIYVRLGSGVFYVVSWLYMGFWFLKEFLNFLYAAEGSGIAFGAHVGGFAAGMIWAWAFFGWDEGERIADERADQTYAIEPEGEAESRHEF